MKKLILILTFSFFSSFLFASEVVPDTSGGSSVDTSTDTSEGSSEVSSEGSTGGSSVGSSGGSSSSGGGSTGVSASDSSTLSEIDSSSLISIDWGGLSSNIITFLFNVLIVFICIGLGIWAVRKLLTLFRRFSK